MASAGCLRQIAARVRVAACCGRFWMGASTATSAGRIRRSLFALHGWQRTNSDFDAVLSSKNPQWMTHFMVR